MARTGHWFRTFSIFDATIGNDIPLCYAIASPKHSKKPKLRHEMLNTHPTCLLLSYCLTFSQLLRGKLDPKPVDAFVDADLAAEAAVGFSGKKLVKHFFLLIGFVTEVMVAKDIDMATATKSHTSAGSQDGEFVGLTGFHDIEANILRDLEGMDLVITVQDFYSDQACF